MPKLKVNRLRWVKGWDWQMEKLTVNHWPRGKGSGRRCDWQKVTRSRLEIAKDWRRVRRWGYRLQTAINFLRPRVKPRATPMR